MTWIRFDGERDFIDFFLVWERQNLFRMGDAYLILVILHPYPCSHCQLFLSLLLEALEKDSDIEAKLLIAGASHWREVLLGKEEVILFSERLSMYTGLKESLKEFSFETSVLLFDPYGSLWFAWIGDDLDAGLPAEILQWLTYLDIQCPE